MKSSISEAEKYEGQEITIRGWVSKIQSFPKHMFIEIRDGCGDQNKIQVVSKIIDVVIEQYVEIKGKVVKLPEGKSSYQPVEIQLKEFIVLGDSNSDFTTRVPQSAGDDVKLEERHLYLRSREFSLMTVLRSMFLTTLRNVFSKGDSVEIIPPCFVGNQCEGGADLFSVKYPPTHGVNYLDAYLTQSSQFYLEMAVPAVGDCHCIYPSFRAERSHTRRHLTEFLHAECEWKDIITFETHLDKLRWLVTSIISEFLFLAEVPLKQLDLYEHVLSLSKMEIITMTHSEAIKECRRRKIYKIPETKTHFDPRDDIPEMQERALIDQIGKIVLLTKFPAEFKSFYMARDPEDPSLALGCDVEVPGVGEVIGSGVRVYDEKELRERLKENGLKEEEYMEYIDLRKYGNARTSGMGLGVDRFLTWLLGKDSIRDIVTFPRYPGRLTP
jgi:asparaginyl-tRNA synthetase